LASLGETFTLFAWVLRHQDFLRQCGHCWGGLLGSTQTQAWLQRAQLGEGFPAVKDVDLRHYGAVQPEAKFGF
jgi:hypothetical protein